MLKCCWTLYSHIALREAEIYPGTYSLQVWIGRTAIENKADNEHAGYRLDWDIPQCVWSGREIISDASKSVGRWEKRSF